MVGDGPLEVALQVGVLQDVQAAIPVGRVPRLGHPRVALGRLLVRVRDEDVGAQRLWSERLAARGEAWVRPSSVQSRIMISRISSVRGPRSVTGISKSRDSSGR